MNNKKLTQGRRENVLNKIVFKKHLAGLILRPRYGSETFIKTPNLFYKIEVNTSVSISKFKIWKINFFKDVNAKKLSAKEIKQIFVSECIDKAFKEANKLNVNNQFNILPKYYTRKFFRKNG